MRGNNKKECEGWSCEQKIINLLTRDIIYHTLPSHFNIKNPFKLNIQSLQIPTTQNSLSFCLFYFNYSFEE